MGIRIPGDQDVEAWRERSRRGGKTDDGGQRTGDGRGDWDWGGFFREGRDDPFGKLRTGF